MIPRQPQDPFTDSNPTSLRTNPSQSSLRSAASTASSRTRPTAPPQLLNPTHTRRPTSRATPRLDSSSNIHEDDPAPAPLQQHHPRRTAAATAQNKRTAAAARTGSPSETRRTKSRNNRGNEEVEFVNRQEDGSYILRLAGYGGVGVSSTSGVFDAGEVGEGEGEEEKQDSEFAKFAREYFTSGQNLALKGRMKRETGDVFDQLTLPMMARLREQAIAKIEGERWLYESVDRVQGGYR